MFPQVIRKVNNNPAQLLVLRYPEVYCDWLVRDIIEGIIPGFMLKYLVTFDSKSRPVEEVAVLQLKKMRNLRKQWLIHR